MRHLIVILPKGLSVDVYDLPDDFESKVKKAFGEYIAKVKKRTLEIRLSKYNLNDERDGQPFISAGWLEAGAGAGSPCDSLEQAYAFLKRAKETA